MLVHCKSFFAWQPGYYTFHQVKAMDPVLQIDHHSGRLRMGAKEKYGRHVSRYRGNF